MDLARHGHGKGRKIEFPAVPQQIIVDQGIVVFPDHIRFKSGSLRKIKQPDVRIIEDAQIQRKADCPGHNKDKQRQRRSRSP